MNENTKTVVTEDVIESAVNHSGLRKGAVVIAVAGTVLAFGYLAQRFILKPIAKKIKAKKALKKPEVKSETRTDFVDDEDDEEVPMLFPESEE